MKKVMTFISILAISFMIVGCDSEPVNHSNEAVENNHVEGVDIYDFAFIRMAPKSEVAHEAKDIIKIYFDEAGSNPEKKVAIDLKKDEQYRNVSLGKRGLHMGEDAVKIDHSKEIIDLIVRYQVQEWAHDYTFEDPDDYEDGSSWSLWLQYEDGSVEVFGGQGSSKDAIIPEHFGDFAAALDKLLKD